MEGGQRNLHRPLHIYLDDEIYVVSCRTYGKIKYFSGERRGKLKESLARAIKLYSVPVFAWVILENHYHVMFKVKGKKSGIDGLTPLQRGKSVRDDNNNKFHSHSRVQFVRPEFDHSPLSNFIREINKNSARTINKIDNQLGRKVWHQYWDRFIRSEVDFYRHFNYIHHNPVKHGYVKNIDELREYKYSSYRSCWDKFGEETINDIWRNNPIADYGEYDN